MDKAEVTIYYSDGNQEQRFLSKENLLKELQEIVGGYIEVIPLPMMQSKCLIVNEEGLIYNLPLNPYHLRLQTHPFVGDAVLIDKSDFN